MAKKLAYPPNFNNAKLDPSKTRQSSMTTITSEFDSNQVAPSPPKVRVEILDDFASEDMILTADITLTENKDQRVTESSSSIGHYVCLVLVILAVLSLIIMGFLFLVGKHTFNLFY
jgi:hypothetical protein